MRIVLKSFAALLALASTQPSAQTPSIAGDWKSDDGKAIIRFAPCGEAMCGRIARFLVPEPAGGARDGENPKAELRERKLLGLRIFWALEPDGKRFKGEGYSPEEGRYFNAQVWRQGANLRVKGCVLLFCRTVTFTPA